MNTSSAGSENNTRVVTKEEELFRRQIAEERSVFEHADQNEKIERRIQYGFHIATSAAWKSYYSSPVHTLLLLGVKVLDVGCGFASWSRSMAKMYPLSQFVACDNIPHSEYDEAEVPPNITFCLADVFEGLPYPAESFDFIFVRSFLCGIPKVRWPEIMNEIMRLLKPGGWIESMELNAIPDPAGPVTKVLGGYLDRSFQRVNLPLPIVENAPDFFNEVEELRQIQRIQGKVPAGKWAGWQGAIMLEHNCLAMEILEPFITTSLGIHIDEYREMVAENIREHEEYKHCIISIRMYAQKAFTEDFTNVKPRC